MSALPARPVDGEKVFITQHAVDRFRERFKVCEIESYRQIVGFLLKASFTGEVVARSKTPGVVAICQPFILHNDAGVVTVVAVLKPTTPGQWYVTSVLTVPILREDSGFMSYPLILSKYA